MRSFINTHLSVVREHILDELMVITANSLKLYLHNNI